MATDVSTPLPQLDLPPSATLTVTSNDPAGVVTQIVVFGTYYPPGDQTPATTSEELLWLPTPIAEQV